MHAPHLPARLLRVAALALGLTLVLLALVSAPTVTTAETGAAGGTAPPPSWIEDPLAPPALLEAR
jgi:hypothetical protein